MNVENEKYIPSLTEVEQKLIYHNFTWNGRELLCPNCR